jgi:peptide/nickel transport system substrate-binding protein
MPVSPTAVNKLGEKFGTAPVCVGPWQFAERVAQDRIVRREVPALLRSGPGEVRQDRLPDHPDDNVRLANLAPATST